MRGAVMVEFAIIVPLLVFFVFGITELGRALYQWNTLTKAVAVGARYMARSNGNLIDIDNNCEEVTTGSGTWDTHASTARNLIIYGQMTTGPEPLLRDLDVTTLASQKGGYGDACVIIVEAKATFETIFGGSSLPWIYGGFGDENEEIKLRARTEERYIGE
jgi:hypothetical protein